MQNNVTELTQRLLRSLDSNYNVIDMPAVIEIISLLEKVVITKELLETTRLGKHVNELRRKTSDESLSRRAKELVKKWRNMVLPSDSNGQIKAPPQEDINLNQVKPKKRSAKDNLDPYNSKRSKLNGISELEFSDNSNSSFKEVLTSKNLKLNNITLNSDSNSSFHEKIDPKLEDQLPKKRGRKKGSKNHKNLLDEAETSFSNKLAVSRGNSKVKTTQELLASLQNKSTNSSINTSPNSKSKEDLVAKAAILHERVSIIDQKLNTNAHRYSKNSRKSKNSSPEKTDRLESLSSNSFNNFNDYSQNNDEIIVVDDIKSEADEAPNEVNDEIKTDTNFGNDFDANAASSLSISECQKLLPPIDKSCLLEDEVEPFCTCMLKEDKKEVVFGENNEVFTESTFEFIEDHECVANAHYSEKYKLNEVTEDRVNSLHMNYLPGMNGNESIGSFKPKCEADQETGLYENVVPNINFEFLPKDNNNDFSCENYKKYSISENSDKSELDRTEASDNKNSDNLDQCYREWHEVVEKPSYNGEILKILPYVIID